MHFKSTEKPLKGTTKLIESTKVCLEYHKWGHPLLAKDNLFNLQYSTMRMKTCDHLLSLVEALANHQCQNNELMKISSSNVSMNHPS
jgi:hypothetical protein